MCSIGARAPLPSISIWQKPLVHSHPASATSTSKLPVSPRILVLQILILRPALPAKTRHIPNLHILRQQLAVLHVIRISRAHDVPPIQPFGFGVVLEEGAFVEVFLHVGHLALGLAL